MKKKFLAGILGAAMAVSMSITAFAGQWKSDASGWWWQNDDGSYPANTWSWIDGNADGIAESYYFNSDGYCLMNTTTPDGYTVNPAGAWTVDGVVQTKEAALPDTKESETVSNAAAINLLDLKPVNKFCFNTFDSARTNKNALWSDGFCLQSNFQDTYVEYYVGGEYNTLTFTYAPVSGAASDLESTLEVYGDDDDLLWSSDTITYKSNAEDVEVDISGQEYIKLNLYNKSRYTIFGSERQIIFKNAKLQ